MSALVEMGLYDEFHSYYDSQTDNNQRKYVYLEVCVSVYVRLSECLWVSVCVCVCELLGPLSELVRYGLASYPPPPREIL